jgi:hypothetical protein
MGHNVCEQCGKDLGDEPIQFCSEFCHKLSKGKPAGGYDFGNKRAYRRTLWNFVDNALRFKNSIKKRKVLILDTNDAEETSFLIDRGYRPNNITVVNRKQIQLDGLVQRFGVKTICDDVFNIINNGNNDYDVINLDLTCPINLEIVGKLDNIPIYDEKIIAISILRGRELDKEIREAYSNSNEALSIICDSNETIGTVFNEMLDEFRANDWIMKIDDLSQIDLIRLALLLGGHKEDSIAMNRIWGRYKSSACSQTMLWAAKHWINCDHLERKINFMSIAEAKEKLPLLETWCNWGNRIRKIPTNQFNGPT